MIAPETPFETVRKLRPDIPTLAEVLALDRGAMDLMIEIKCDQHTSEETVAETLAIIRRSPEHTGKIYIGGPCLSTVRELLKQQKSYPVIGIANNEEILNAYLKLPIRHLALPEPLALAEEADDLIALGYHIWVWSVDDPEMAKKLHSKGIEGVITKDPRNMLKTLDLSS